jgi:hypothetical protein
VDAVSKEPGFSETGDAVETETSLTDTAGTSQGDEANIGAEEEIAYSGEFPRTPDQGGEREGQGAEASEGYRADHDATSR